MTGSISPGCQSGGGGRGSWVQPEWPDILSSGVIQKDSSWVDRSVKDAKLQCEFPSSPLVSTEDSLTSRYNLVAPLSIVARTLSGTCCRLPVRPFIY